MNDLMNELSGKVIRVVDKHFSNFMTDQEIRNSVQMRFKNHVSYKIIKNLNVSFWKNIYDSWCKDLFKDVNDSYYLSNHLKVPQTKSGKYKNSTKRQRFSCKIQCSECSKKSKKVEIMELFSSSSIQKK